MRYPPFPGSTDESLVIRIQRSSQDDAWGEFVNIYGGLVFYWLGKLHVPPDDYEDVFQDVFRAVAAKIAHFRYKYAGGSLRGWLRTITTSKARDYFRATRQLPQAIGGSEAQRLMSSIPQGFCNESDISSSANAEELAQIFPAVLAFLKKQFEENTWQAFLRTTMEKASAPEVARELGMTPSSVRQAKSRVLRRLKQEFGEFL